MIKAEFNRLSRPPDAKLSRLIDAIIAERPDLAEATFYVPAQGNSAYTLIAGDEVFKAPRDRKDIPAFYREFRVQQALTEAGIDGIAPLTCVGRKSCFFAVRKLDGMPFDLGYMTAHQQEALFTGMGPALARVSQAWKGGRTPCKKDNADFIVKGLRCWRSADVRRLYFAADPEMAALMDDYARRFSKRRPVLAHGDLHEGNVFVNRSDKTFSALIDWGRTYLTKAPEEEFHRFAERMYGFEGMVLSAFAGYCAQAGDLFKPSDICMARGFIALGFFSREMSPDAPAQMRQEMTAHVLEKIREEMQLFGIDVPVAKPSAATGPAL